MQDYSIITDNIEAIKEMAAIGDADAQNKLGVCYKLGLAGFPKDAEEAVRWYTKSANQGWDKAQLNLAYCYLNGQCVAQNSKTAVEWFTKAAEQENAIALFQLGWCYSKGDGICKDLKKAVEYFRKAANQGYSNAQLDLGYAYDKGLGIRKNARLAFEWYEKAAKQGNIIAQANLGFCYERGEGVNQSYEFAVEWYCKAAEQGDARAMNNLGYLYENGRGVEKDINKAFELYTKAAELCFVLAFANLGYFYEEGLGTKKNLRKAEDWYNKAADNGNDYAKKALKRIKEKIEEEEWIKSLDFSTRQKIKRTFYSRVIPFSKNYIVKQKGLWGIVDKDEHILLPIEYTRVHWFDGGCAGIQINNKWGLVNSDGVITIKPQYDTLHYLSQYNACDVELGGDRYVVDVNGKAILRINGKNVRFLGDKLCVSSKEGCQLYNLNGTPISKMHSYISIEGNKYMGYNKDGHKTIINATGEEVELPDYEIAYFREHISQFRYQNKYGIIDENAHIVVPNKFDYISLGSGVIAINEGNVTKDGDRYFLATPRDGEWYFWNYDFKEITPHKYAKVHKTYKHGGEDALWLAERDGIWYEITSDGERLFANTETEYQKKKAAIERERKTKSEGKFDIFGDPKYKEDNRKLFVRACDGKYIRHFYYTPYLAMPADELMYHWKIGESFVNIYGQDMPNPHAFKMPKQKKPRYIFKLNPTILKLDDKEMIELFVGFLKLSGFEKKEIIDLYAIFGNHKKRAIICDWLYRKYNRHKKIKYEFNKLACMAIDIDNWLKKHK